MLQAGDEGPFLEYLARQLLREGIEQLVGTERECAELLLLYGRSVPEIAEELSLSVECAVHHLEQARESLRSFFSVEPT